MQRASIELITFNIELELIRLKINSIKNGCSCNCNCITVAPATVPALGPAVFPAVALAI